MKSLRQVNKYTKGIFVFLKKNHKFGQPTVWSTNCAMTRSVDWDFWNPKCLTHRILWAFKHFWRQLYITGSRVLEKYSSTDIGLWLLTVMLLLAWWRSAVTLAVSRSSGQISLTSERLIKYFSGFRNLLKHFLWHWSSTRHPLDFY